MKKSNFNLTKDNCQGRIYSINKVNSYNHYPLRAPRLGGFILDFDTVARLWYTEIMNYKDILKSDYFKATYTQIEEMKKDFPVNHGFIHIRNVLAHAKELAREFGLTNPQRKNLYIACVLHDIGYLSGRKDHAESGAILAREYLSKCGLKQTDISVICSAIALHGGKDKAAFLCPVARCLAIADKMDLTRDRYDQANPSYDVSIFDNIYKSNFKVTDGGICLTITVSPAFDKAAFLSTYFGQKLTSFLALAATTLSSTPHLTFKNL